MSDESNPTVILHGEAGLPAVDADALRQVMRRWPSGVAIVTSHYHVI